MRTKITAANCEAIASTAAETQQHLRQGMATMLINNLPAQSMYPLLECLSGLERIEADQPQKGAYGVFRSAGCLSLGNKGEYQGSQVFYRDDSPTTSEESHQDLAQSD